jgi:hypothetical protein
MQAIYGKDLPEVADVTKHLLRHGDVLIFATDGVWDNLTHQDVLKVVSRLMFSLQAWDHTEEGIQVGEKLAALTMPGTPASESGGVSSLQSILASGIVKEAEAASVNKHVDGEVNRLFPTTNRRGGKVDDICVVVAIVVEEHGVQTNAASEPQLPSAKRQQNDNSIMGSQKRHKSHAEPTDPESSFNSFISSTDEMSPHSSSEEQTPSCDKDEEEAESRFSGEKVRAVDNGEVCWHCGAFPTDICHVISQRDIRVGAYPLSTTCPITDLVNPHSSLTSSLVASSASRNSRTSTMLSLYALTAIAASTTR